MRTSFVVFDKTEAEVLGAAQHIFLGIFPKPFVQIHGGSVVEVQSNLTPELHLQLSTALQAVLTKQFGSET